MITDKDIHKACEATALSCPNCGGKLMLNFSQELNFEERAIIARLLESHMMELSPLEDEIEQIKEARDNGTINPCIKEFAQ